MPVSRVTGHLGHRHSGPPLGFWELETATGSYFGDVLLGSRRLSHSRFSFDFRLSHAILVISYICGSLACWFRLRFRSPFFHQPELNSFPIDGLGHSLAVENSCALFRSFRISYLRTLARSSAQEYSGNPLESWDSALFART